MPTIKSTVLLALAATGSLASPAMFHPRQEAPAPVTVTVTAASETPSSTAWNAGAVVDYPIHSSCNSTQHAQLKRGLDEAVEISRHAREHILRWGNSSEIYQKYFGQSPTAEPIGWFDRVANADKKGVLFRCDDPDENCATQAEWAGHWRGDNATQETVICDLSFHIRRNLDAMCNLGYTVSGSKKNFYWASDLLHRLLHVPSVSEGAVDHFASTYHECLDLAVADPAEAARNSDSLQYFALEAYAYDVAVPGEGCLGAAALQTATTTAAAAATTATPEASAPATTVVADVTPSGTASADASCHTHEDGVVHCGGH